MKAIGVAIKRVDMGNLYTQMVIIMKVNGEIIRQMGKEDICKYVVLQNMDHGRMMYRMYGMNFGLMGTNYGNYLNGKI